MLIEVGRPQRHLQSIRRIFFESSVKKDFRDEAERERFFQKWTEYYLSEYPKYVYTACDQGGEVLGYLMGCPDSRQALSHFANQISSYSLFADLFDRFPAHLHINLTDAARGRGLGGQLIEAFIRDIKGSAGVHIVTSQGARNAGFYKKNGFTYEDVRELKGAHYLFMGRRL